MSMQTTSDNAEGQPMIDMNVTPLIDVMLVLLIMFIITIPVQTHAVKLDLPQNTNTPPPPVLPEKNIVVVTAQDPVVAGDQLEPDGAPFREAALDRLRLLHRRGSRRQNGCRRERQGQDLHWNLHPWKRRENPVRGSERNYDDLR